MQIHEFFQKYANTPLDDRVKLISFKKDELLNLNEIYQRVKELEDEMRPKCIERDKLISQAEQYWLNLKKNK